MIKFNIGGVTMNTNIYVTINYELEGSKSTEMGNGAHINNSKNINSSKYLIAGGFYNKNRGTMLFNARTMEEAEEIVNINKLTHNNGNYEVVIHQ